MPILFNSRLLARVRVDLGLTQEEAAAAVGVDVRTYRRYESGEVNDATDGFSVRHASRRRILAGIGRELGIPEADLLVDGAAPPAAATPEAPTGWAMRHAHGLPRAQHFVGRADLLRRLDAFWEGRTPETRIMAIVALGGAGKTSLVERWLASIGDGPHPAGVLVFSFYDDDRVEAFFDRALAYFAPATAPSSVAGRFEALQAALSNAPEPHLVVLDGLEILQGSGEAETTYGRVQDGALRRLLASIARGLGRSRFLVTSRFELTDLAAWEGSGLSTVKLEALSAAEGLELLERWGLCGGRDELEKLLERVGRHALSLAMVGSYAGAFLGGHRAGAGAAELLRLLRPGRLEPAARDDDKARRLLAVLSAYARALSAEERDLLARLAVFPAGADLEALQAIARAGGAVGGALAGLDSRSLAPIVARLERLGLVAPLEGRRYAAHPVVAQYFRSILGVPVEAIHEIERDRIAARLDAHDEPPVADELLDRHEILFFHTLGAGQAEEAALVYLRGLGGFSHLGLRLGAMSRGARMLRSFAADGDPTHVTEALSPERKARIQYDWGLYAGALGDLALAIRCYRAHNATARAIASLDALTTGLRTLAYTERLAGALDEALALADAAAEVARRADSPGDVVRAVALRAAILHDLGDLDGAEEGFARARALGDEPLARRSLWEAEHALGVGRVEDAIAETTKNLASLRRLGWEGHVAHAHTLLGLAVLRRADRDPAEARQHHAMAARWTAATGEVEVILRCHELEAAIELAESHRAAAARAIRRGRELAETCGFGLFAARFDDLAAEHAGFLGRG